ncbi:DgyrCDS5728 [Dimorphilus gyrociliatus]|uniref:ATP synthase F(1) complex subunit delta, mitochondrial n=1 Tax=Dimorphilus gyrociliatus TaxID=2664684 RepID=A0A7I8VMB9_9ANNE|nr:DgyrCDS5728 [Dimorphilus gyrociliatus]
MSLLRSFSRLPTRGISQSFRVLSSQHVTKRNYADMSFTLSSPAQVVYENANVKQIDVPSFSGSFGILPQHVPILAAIKPGVLTVYEESGSTKKFFVSSGSVSVNEDSSVQVLAEELAEISELDSAAIRDGLNQATQKLQSASGETAKAEAQIAVECYEALQKALD